MISKVNSQDFCSIKQYVLKSVLLMIIVLSISLSVRAAEFNLIK